MCMCCNLDDLFNHIECNILSNQKLSDFRPILENYLGDDWKQYVKKNKIKYNKEYVKVGKNIELIIITWGIGQMSKIHDHPDCGCLVKILSGKICEKIYEKMEDEDEIVFIEDNILTEKCISYKESNKIVHKIENNFDDICVSLHIYSPPNFVSNYV
jgi:predicted metal-dependent enzyme (double-stranded beta helix superfamily)